MEEPDTQEIAQETPAENVFIAPSISPEPILDGASYTYHSPIPSLIAENLDTECVLGIDEAGRGPVLGPMVYGLFYLPLAQHKSLLSDTHKFDDSKVLTPEVRSALLKTLCTAGTDLHSACGWATRVMSAQDIGAGQLKPIGMYNLNQQAKDATVTLIKDVLASGINVKEIYIDTIGKPEVYQRQLERVFPSCSVTVAKKADSLYPCVSAASVCAKVTRDTALEVAYQSRNPGGTSADGWGSGYPSDERCVNWLNTNMDPLFGWGNECRFSWRTVKDLMDNKTLAHPVEWPDPDEVQGPKVTDYFTASGLGKTQEGDELAGWFGRPVGESVF